MPFSSYTFIEFSKKWNFQVITSSPHYAQSNGLAEQGVGIAKYILKKTYRNTPITGLQYSPAQLLQSRELRSTLFVDKDKFKPKVYDKSARKVFENFSEGQVVYVQDIFNKKWSEGKILKRLPKPRSYLVKLQGDNKLRRNVQSLKKQNYEVNTETDIENNVTEDENIQNNVVSNNTKTKTKRGRSLSPQLSFWLPTLPPTGPTPLQLCHLTEHVLTDYYILYLYNILCIDAAPHPTSTRRLSFFFIYSSHTILKIYISNAVTDPGARQIWLPEKESPAITEKPALRNTLHNHTERNDSRAA
ncbi:hypothetical protein AGLY_003654 [Aphis glycines]|uniref:Integrase catalytic domain-containing protein n=1 Tax=Aphis glycines TaxID=307491 RepID=A0A6G0TYW2_APHGL|nr:hypothetical protein AGLY_003654 [Aphis glycines]